MGGLFILFVVVLAITYLVSGKKKTSHDGDRLRCPVCRGLSKIKCSVCGGTGNYLGEKCPHVPCRHGLVDCPGPGPH